MTNKYIVKNCELICNGECPNSKTGFCEDCTDCLIKQVVEKCKKYNSDLALTGYQQGKEDFADEILQLFTIEEVE